MEVFNSLKGTVCNLDTSNITNLDEFRERICEDQGIEKHQVFLLVAPSGNQMKDLTASRVFIYDKQWTQSHSTADNNTEDHEGQPDICIEAANLAIANLHHNMSIISKLLTKTRNAMAQLEPDVNVCGSWRRYYEALQQIPELSPHISELLDLKLIEESFTELSVIWNRIVAELGELPGKSDELRRKASINEVKKTASLTEAQEKLVATLQTVGNIQLSIKTNLRRPLSSIGDELKRAEDLKSQVAKVIDLPFLYGVLLIESSRRKKWKTDFGPIWNRESERRSEWKKHYCAGSVGALVERLDEIGKFDVLSDDLDDLFKSPNSGQSDSSVIQYLRILEELNLDDVRHDLTSELGAMKRQLARSMSASISSLVPGSTFGTLSPGGVLANPQQNHNQQHTQSTQASSSHNSIVAAYEARIRKLETILLQSRLGSKTHELDIIRAETRAEARAEARAEVKAEQQQIRISELEKQNHELAGRLHHYVSGLEVVLNSMGLQTSRVDPDTGVYGAYHINRVKGLSKTIGRPPASDSNQDLGSNISSGSGSNSGSTSSTGNQPTSHTTDSTRSIPLDRLVEQTFVDNRVLYEAVNKRFGDVERLARKLQIENRRLRDHDTKLERDLRQRVALHSFRAEDLILFLPTRDTRRQPNPWAAFNAGAPHYFLHPKHAEQLQNREYLIARASGIERHVAGNDEENIYQLPVGVEWFLISIHGEWGV